MFPQFNWRSIERKCEKAGRACDRVNGQWRSRKRHKKRRKYRAADKRIRKAWDWALDKGWVPF